MNADDIIDRTTNNLLVPSLGNWGKVKLLTTCNAPITRPNIAQFTEYFFNFMDNKKLINDKTMLNSINDPTRIFIVIDFNTIIMTIVLIRMKPITRLYARLLF